MPNLPQTHLITCPCPLNEEQEVLQAPALYVSFTRYALQVKLGPGPGLPVGVLHKSNVTKRLRYRFT